jgi:hypothetical protein
MQTGNLMVMAYVFSLAKVSVQKRNTTGSFELKPASQASREYWAKSLAFSYNINE